MTRIYSVPDQRSFSEPGEIRPIIVSAVRQSRSPLGLTRGTGYGVGQYHGSLCLCDRKSRAVAYAPHRLAR
jgi:hypothetical protein